MRIAIWTLILLTTTVVAVQTNVALAVSLPADIDYNQCDLPWRDEPMGEIGVCAESICGTGTVVTCVAMLLSWVASDQGLPDPGMLNTWLRDNGGYYSCGLIWARADDYDGDGAGLEYLGSLSLGFDDWVSLDVELDASDRMPMVAVNSGGHWVVVYDRIGPSGVPSSYLVLDSNQFYSSDRTLADYPSGDRTIFRLATFSGIFPFGEVTGIDNGEWMRPVMLDQNSPNPFNPQTTIAFELPEREAVSLRVFDVAGRLVRELIDGEVYGQGRHETVWSGRDDGGRQMSSGTYFYRLEAGEFQETKRMVLLK